MKERRMTEPGCTEKDAQAFGMETTAPATLSSEPTENTCKDLMTTMQTEKWHKHTLKLPEHLHTKAAITHL